MKTFRFLACFFVLSTAATTPLLAQGDNVDWAQGTANSAMARWPDGRFVTADAPWHWNYELGTLLEGMDGVWFSTADGADFKYIKSSVDQLVTPDGTIPTLKPEDHELDNILLGRQLLLLYRVTLDKRYLTAATFLNDQLAQQPRNADGGYWHKQRYPNQMWLDGLYMASPFYAECGQVFGEAGDFNEAVTQIRLINQHTLSLIHI